VQAFEVEVHPRVLALLAGPGGTRLEELEAAARRRFFLVPAAGNGHVHLDHVEVVRQGKLDTLRPETPVADGDEIELKLVEVGLHDPTAAVGKLDGGYEVVVSGASKLVGKKVKASVGRALHGTAFAALADGQTVPASPITFEAEAEKPMRASRSKKETTVVEDAPVEPEETIVEEVEDLDDESVEAASAETATDGQPKKKRTRRGTRGGKGRKKPAAAAPAGADEGADDSANGRPQTPRIHVPPPDLEAAATTEALEPIVEPSVEDAPPVAADGQPKKKRSRRGSRGGRKRKKPAAANGAEEATAGESDAAVSTADESTPEYVPMSEWIEDFDAARGA
jgi:predicted RNA-binding protein with TRAM domain